MKNHVASRGKVLYFQIPQVLVIVIKAKTASKADFFVGVWLYTFKLKK
jgi:hypothetical protein